MKEHEREKKMCRLVVVEGGLRLRRVGEGCVKENEWMECLGWRIIIIIIITIILGISFMQSIYTYIPETNHVPREHCVATILM